MDAAGLALTSVSVAGWRRGVAASAGAACGEEGPATADVGWTPATTHTFATRDAHENAIAAAILAVGGEKPELIVSAHSERTVRRLASAREPISFGLIVSERSSGERRSRGGVSKTGNGNARGLLV